MLQMPPREQSQVEMPTHPMHLEGSPPSGLEQLTAFQCGAPELGLCAVGLVDVTQFVVGYVEEHLWGESNTELWSDQSPLTPPQGSSMEIPTIWMTVGRGTWNHSLPRPVVFRL